MPDWKLLSLAAAAALAACDPAPVPEAASEQAAPAPAAIDPAAVEQARAAIAKEPRVELLLHRASEHADEWLVGIEDEGSAEFGYAEFICLQLLEAGARRDDTDVYVLDHQLARAAGGVDVVEKSVISGVRCSNGRRLTAWPPQRLS